MSSKKRKKRPAKPTKPKSPKQAKRSKNTKPKHAKPAAPSPSRVKKSATASVAKPVNRKVRIKLPNWRAKLPKLSKRLQMIVGGSTLVLLLAMAGSFIMFHVEAEYDEQRPVAFVPSIYNVADILVQHHTGTLISAQGMLKVLRPTLGEKQQTFVLNTCPSTNDTVVKQLQKHSIAILLTIDNTPGSRQCTLAQIVQAYGRPNSSVTITGSLKNPKEVLLFYDDGPGLSGPLHPISPVQAPATVVPVTLATLPPTSCGGKAVLSVVAHEDDDLLFMNPDHIHDLQSGGCLRTVYLTAGDAGLGSSYWLSREEGAEAAYDAMLGQGRLLWIERMIEVNSHEYIRMASPRGNSQVTLIFVRLPDGNVTGSGFPRTRYESLARLLSGAIGTMNSVDEQSSYTKSDVTNLLASLMRYYHPNEIDTQTPINMSTLHSEHSDHMATGQFTAAAYGAYAQGALAYYTGYPVDQLPTNVGGQDLADKTAAFNAYAAYDDQICKTNCVDSPYTQWLQREYTYTPGMPPISTTPPITTPTPTTTVAPTTTDPSSGTTPPPATTPVSTDPPSS